MKSKYTSLRKIAFPMAISVFALNAFAENPICFYTNGNRTAYWECKELYSECGICSENLCEYDSTNPKYKLHCCRRGPSMHGCNGTYYGLWSFIEKSLSEVLKNKK